MALGNKTLQDLLAPISQQQGRTAPSTSVSKPADWAPTPVRATDGLSQDALVDMFAEEAQKVRVGVHRCASDGLAQCIAGIIEAGEADGAPPVDGPLTVVVANDDRFEACGLVQAVEAVDTVQGVTVWNAENGRDNVEAARVARYGITYACKGIAETATIAQPCNPRCGRAISLLPLVHIAVVDADSIVGTMGDVMKKIQACGDGLPSQVCFISGPSATADIELVRVEGVHGPMYVNYVIVE